jgi:hypothetical protein
MRLTSHTMTFTEGWKSRKISLYILNAKNVQVEQNQKMQNKRERQ